MRKQWQIYNRSCCQGRFSRNWQPHLLIPVNCPDCSVQRKRGVECTESVCEAGSRLGCGCNTDSEGGTDRRVSRHFAIQRKFVDTGPLSESPGPIASKDEPVLAHIIGNTLRIKVNFPKTKKRKKRKRKEKKKMDDRGKKTKRETFLSKFLQLPMGRRGKKRVRIDFHTGATAGSKGSEENRGPHEMCIAWASWCSQIQLESPRLC